MWAYGLKVLWKDGFADDAGIFVKAFIGAFSLLWSAGAVAAIGAGLVGCFHVFMSLVTSLQHTFSSLPLVGT